MMQRAGFCLIFVMCGLTWAQTTRPRLLPLDEIIRRGEERARFIEVEKLARLPKPEQERRLPEFYGGLTCYSLMSLAMEELTDTPATLLENSGLLYEPQEKMYTLYDNELNSPEAAKLTPEQLADKIMAVHDNSTVLNIASRRRAIYVLKQHKPFVTEIAQRDLASGNFDRAIRAFNIFSSLEIQELVEPIVKIYLSNDDRSGSAKYALRWVNLIFYAQPLLAEIEKDPTRVNQHWELLDNMIDNDPAPPVLVKLLDSPVLELRRDAARSLIKSGDPNLAPFVTKLRKDQDYELRVALVKIGFSMPDEQFLKIRTDLLGLMYTQKGVQYAAMYGFAKRQDTAATNIIMELLKEPELDPVGIAEVRRSYEALTGDELDYDFKNWGPGKERNDRAIKDFEEWIDENILKLANGRKAKSEL